MPKLPLRSADLAVRRLARDVVLAAKTAEMRSARTGVQLAQGLSGGGKSSAQLAREDHPFAKRHGSPKDITYLINEQSGRFRAAWRLKTSTILRDFAPVIVNDTPYADFLRYGTRKAFRRDIDDAVLDYLMPVRMGNLKQELKKLEK